MIGLTTLLPAPKLALPDMTSIASLFYRQQPCDTFILSTSDHDAVQISKFGWNFVPLYYVNINTRASLC